MRYIAVFDTNVLLSGIAWKGKPFECLELARAGRIQSATCKPILDELALKLHSKLKFSDAEIADTLSDLLSFLALIEVPGKLKVVAADPDDDKVLECAAVGSATHLVTGDRKH